MKFFKKKFVWAIIFSALLISFTAYLLLDTFVIKRVYSVVGSADASGGLDAESTSGSGTSSDSDISSDTDASSASGDTSGSDTSSDDATSGSDASSDTDTSSGDTDAGLNGSNTETDTGGSGTDTDTSGSDTDVDTNGSDADTTDDDADTESSTAPAGTLISQDTYEDGNISITITSYRAYDTTIYVADVQVTSAQYLKAAFADSSYGRNITEKTSDIASENGALLAINGDFYGSQSSGYVIRNGQLYRDRAKAGQEDLVIREDGSFSIISEDEVSAAKLIADGAVQVFSFGPALVTDGDISVRADEEVGKSMASNPRTAIGIVDDLHYLFVVSDGRTSESAGLSLSQLAEFMQSLSVTTAYNLDGGGSSTMVYDGEVINNPTTSGRSIKEREVSDIVYIGA